MKISQEVMNPMSATLSNNVISRNEIVRTDKMNVNDIQDKQVITTEKISSQEKNDTQKGDASKDVIKAIEEANKKLKGNDKQFEFAVHEQTKQIMVKVIDTKTHEILKEFPSEKILDMVANMCEAAGLFVDEKR